ncbi:MAG: Uma2 family endonuclease [Phormidesmis sp.]
MISVQPKRFTLKQYHDMSELGILSPTERTELINGEIVTMAAKVTAHTSAVLVTHHLLIKFLSERAFVQCQDPIQLSDRSEPEPDVAVVKLDPLAYSTRHPAPEDVLLLIEVAGSSLKYDLENEAPIYAAANIADYWILDVIERELHVFRQPANGRYQSHLVLASALSISPLAFNDLEIQILDMLPPQPSMHTDLS